MENNWNHSTNKLALIALNGGVGGLVDFAWGEWLAWGGGNGSSPPEAETLLV